MDFVEKLFGFASNRLARRKRERGRKRQGARAACLDDLLLPAVTFLNCAARESGLVVRDAVGQGAVYPGTVLLPASIARCDTQEANAKAYLHKALVAGVIHRLRLAFTAHDLTLEQKEAENLSHRATIRTELQEEFPGYDEFFAELLPILNTTDPTPWVDLMRPTLTTRHASESNARGASESKEKPKSEMKGKSPNEVNVVDLAKKRDQENPTLHSFEKLETADEYSGGYRVQDGGDQLEDHAAALEELNMNSVTRDGESASSTYQGTIADLCHAPDASADAARSDRFEYYPEWDYQSQNLKIDHCRLYEGRIAGDDGVVALPNKLSKLMEEHGAQVEAWRGLIDSLLNQSGWQDRQLEGPELSVDAFVRYFSDFRQAGVGDPRLFLRKTPTTQDFASLILLDQSLSTDSWVQNHRVLDVEVDAIRMVSLLFSHLSPRFAVAGCASETRNHCYFFWYKKFQDEWSAFHNASSKIEPRGYTRLGVAIRHATAQLAQESARQRLLILLTDGKPTDHDRYEGRYGVQDVRHAILEARQKGVHVKAFAVEADAKYYFPLMFGAGSFQIMLDVAKLPEALFNLYWDVLKK